MKSKEQKALDNLFFRATNGGVFKNTRIQKQKDILQGTINDLELYKKALELSTRPAFSYEGYNDKLSKEYYLELARKELNER